MARHTSRTRLPAPAAYRCPECEGPLVIHSQPRPRTGRGRHSFGYTQLLYGCPVALDAADRKERIDTMHGGYVKLWPEDVVRMFAEHWSSPVWAGTAIDDCPF